MSKVYEKEIDLSDPNDAHAMMIAMTGADRRVVDFGCSSGYVARLLKERGCYVVGIEIDPEAARLAEDVCDRVVVGDLDTLDLESTLGGERFDVGLFGDVIEHLKDPKRVLVGMSAALSPGGFVVVSVPNIAHASIRLKLLRGEWTYEETGILDDTHLKYYTRESIGDFLESCGYMVDRIDWVDQRVPAEELRRTLDPLGLSGMEEVVKAFSSWEAVAYQYVVKAFPAGEEEQVRRLSEEKVQAERRLQALERELEEYEKVKREFRKGAEYIGELESKIEAKDRYIKQLEQALAERDRALSEKSDEPGSSGRRRRRI